MSVATFVVMLDIGIPLSSCSPGEPLVPLPVVKLLWCRVYALSPVA